jgi:H+-transporting ATPase
MGVGELIFCIAVLGLGKLRMHLSIEALRTLALVTLAFSSEATLYAIRERRRLWSSRPSLWVIVSSACDVLIVVALATRGIAMTPLPFEVIAWTLTAAVAFGFVIDMVKAPVFSRLRIT